MNTSDFKRDDWLVLGLALVLVIDLIALPWFDVGIGPISVTATATSAPDSVFGILAFLLVLVVGVDLAIERLSPNTTLPNIGGSRTVTRWWLTVAATVFVALKFLTNIHFSEFGFGFWLAVILTAGLLYATWQLSKDKAVMPSA
jgi:uncharacterized membrane protein